MVMRYDFNLGDAFQDDGKCGDYVRYSDYAKLEEQLKEQKSIVINATGDPDANNKTTV